MLLCQSQLSHILICLFRPCYKYAIGLLIRGNQTKEVIVQAVLKLSFFYKKISNKNYTKVVTIIVTKLVNISQIEGPLSIGVHMHGRKIHNVGLIKYGKEANFSVKM